MEQLQIEDRTPKWNLTQDADILKLAHTTLQGIPMNYSHIKSHQDKIKKANELSFSAQLNITADELAVRRREAMPAPCTTVTTPNIHLTINDVTITRDSQKWLMDTASRVPIQQYYHDKHKWSNEAFHSINWSAQQKVLTSYDSNDQ
jgi:hypothetical protein